MIIGYLHRGTEKLIEYKKNNQVIPYFDRLDYVSVVFCEESFVYSFEGLFGFINGVNISISRIFFMEVTRIFNGLLAVSCMVMDIGSLSPIMWSFEERCKIMGLFEYVCGARMHVAYISLFGISDSSPTGLYDIVNFILTSNLLLLDIYDSFCVNNRIFYLRLRGISIMSIFDVTNNSISGVLARATGICYDLRLVSPYECYSLMSFDIVTSYFGDALDRVIIRNIDMRNSCKIIFQTIRDRTHINAAPDFIFSDIQIENIIFIFYSI